MAESQENIQVDHAINEKTGCPCVIIRIGGEDRYLLTPKQAEEMGKAFMEKAAFARYESAAWERIATDGCANHAGSIIKKFRATIQARKNKSN